MPSVSSAGPGPHPRHFQISESPSSHSPQVLHSFCILRTNQKQGNARALCSRPPPESLHRISFPSLKKLPRTTVPPGKKSFALDIESPQDITGGTSASFPATRANHPSPDLFQLTSGTPKSMSHPSLSSEELTELKKEAASMAGVPVASISVVFSPYRVCPLGAHIDHQGGPVTAMALDFGVTFAFASCSSPTVILKSHQYQGTATFRLDEEIVLRSKEAARGQEGQGEEGDDEKASWGNYARGAAWAFKEAGYELQKGIVGVIAGHPGVDCAGISSSAAVGVAYLLAFASANGLAVGKYKIIELDRRVENGFLGLNNGVLDQSAIVLSKKDCLTLINCRTMQHDIIPFPQNIQISQKKHLPLAPESHPGNSKKACRCGQCSLPSSLSEKLPFRILLAFSGVTAALTSSSGFNNRVQECKEAAAALQQQSTPCHTTNLSPTTADSAILSTTVDPAILSNRVNSAILSDVSTEEFQKLKHKLPPNLSKRAEHFFGECQRVEDGVRLWGKGDIVGFGGCVSESGQSSIDKYECGIEPMVELRRILLQTPGVLGCRFSGAGFRGCCVALVWRCMAEDAKTSVEQRYREIQPDLAGNVPAGKLVIVCDSGDGARIF